MKASTQQSEPQGSGWAVLENEKDTTLTALGSKYFSYVRSQLPLTVKPHTTFLNPCDKVRGKYFSKKSSCMRLYRCVCLFMVSLWCCRWVYNKAAQFLRKNIPLTLLNGLCVRGSWRPNRTATYWLPLYWP